MHIVRVVGKLEPGGAQLALLRLTRELSRRHGVDTTLLVGDATPHGLELARQHGVEPHAFYVAPALDPLRNRQWRLSRRFSAWLADKLGDADLVHAHMVGAWWATAQVIDGRAPFVATEHNQVNWTRRRVRALRMASQRVDRFYAMGPAAARFALDAGVPPQVLRASRSPVARTDAAPDLGLPRPRLTFAGRFDLDKGPDVLLDALSLLNTEIAPPHAFMLGDGPLRAPLVARARRRGLTRRVTMPGWIDQPWAYVAGSAVHVVPSREEAWSQSAVLAMALGVPVIGTDVDGLTGTLGDGRGVTVHSDDSAALATAIDDVLAGRATIDRAGARRYAKQFTPERVADFYAAEYRALIDAPRPALSVPPFAGADALVTPPSRPAGGSRRHRSGRADPAPVAAP